MKIQGEQSYPHPPQRVWQALLDPNILSRTLPGCEDLQEVGEHQYAGKLKMKVGPVQGVFQGGVTLSEIDELRGYHMKIEGKGAPGFMNGEGDLKLEEQDGGTLLHYDIDAQVGGRIASVGQRLLDSSAKVITKQGLAGLGKQLDGLAELDANETLSAETADAVAEADARAAEAAATAESADEAPTTEAAETAPPAREKPTPVEAPTQAEFAGEFAREMAKELIPPKARLPLGVTLLFLAAAILALSLRACGA